MPTRYFLTPDLDSRIQVRGLVAQLREDPDVVEVGLTYYPRGEDGRAAHMRVILDAGRVLENGLFDRLLEESTSPLRQFFRLGQEDPPRVPDRSITTNPDPGWGEGVLSRSMREHFVQEAMRASGMLQPLARAMVAPLRRTLDYQSIGRRTFLVDQIPDGAVPTYTEPNANGDVLPNGIRVIQSRLVPPGHVYVTTDPENFGGRIPVGTELTVLPADEPQNPIGWTVREHMGIGVVNQNALTRMGFGRVSAVEVQLPDWVQPGVWAYSSTLDMFARVVHVETYRATLLVWRYNRETTLTDADVKLQGWGPSLEPRMPLSWHDRLLDNDLV